MQLKEIMDQNRTTLKECNLSEDEIVRRKKILVHIANKHISNFQIDESNKYIISNLFNYFNDIPGEYDLNKGLWLYGDVGTGKSSLMKVFSEYMKVWFNGFKIHICDKVSNEYAMSGSLDEFTYNENGYIGYPVWMCFDELGRETIPANHFGTKLNVMQHILHIRYSLWQSTRLKTFVTTNSGPKNIEENYGDFIRDRTREMFNIIFMGGESRRK